MFLRAVSASMEYGLGADESLSAAVVRAVSGLEGREPLDLPPLVNLLDPDALDMLFATDGTGEPKSGGRISFIYSESCITIENGEYFTIQPVYTSRAGARCHGGPSQA